jgi:lysophospholipid acyltransferase (LPLAT)-like uncharacterized protein
MINKGFIDEMKWNAVGYTGKWIIDVIGASLRIEKTGWDRVAPIFRSRKYIMCLWHSRLLVLSYIHQHSNVLVLVSQSKDGEIIARILDKQGHETMRGSSTRGGLRALAGMIKNIKENNRPAAFTPDGPQGPRFKIKPGIIALAKKTGYPIIPMSYNASKIKVINSWDRFIVPMPFSRCQLIYGAPIYVPASTDDDQANVYQEKLQNEMDRITKWVDNHFNHVID